MHNRNNQQAPMKNAKKKLQSCYVHKTNKVKNCLLWPTSSFIADSNSGPPLASKALVTAPKQTIYRTKTFNVYRSDKKAVQSVSSEYFGHSGQCNALLGANCPTSKVGASQIARFCIVRYLPISLYPFSPFIVNKLFQFANRRLIYLIYLFCVLVN